VLLALAAALAAPADVITFKDGYTVTGKVKKEAAAETDPYTHEQLILPVFKGYWILDDGPRFVLFGTKQVAKTDGGAAEGDSITFFRGTRRFRPAELPNGASYAGATPWGKDGRRTLFLKGPQGRASIDQNLTILTPQFARIDAINYTWTAFYRTTELGPEMVRSLAEQHPDVREEAGKPDPEKRIKLFRFLAQSGWLDEAGKELDRLLKDMPGEKKRVDDARASLNALYADRVLEEAERARRAGRHEWAQKALAEVEKLFGPLNNAHLIRLNAIRDQYAEDNRKLQDSLKSLDAVLDQVNGPTAEFACTVLGTIRSELDLDGADRLDTFVTLTQQAERDRQAGRRVQQTPEELAALAVTGWLVGKTAAEAKPEAARKLWQVRETVLELQRTADANARQQLLDGVLKDSPPAYDVLGQLLAGLPPPEPGNSGPGVQNRSVEAPGTSGRGRYKLILPPEYRPGRAYPVLLVLRAGDETSQDALNRWAILAARDGYILAAPAWGNDLQTTYDFDGSEHTLVLDTLRDLKQHYRVDTDRVFLAGYADGANLALDVGLSHPSVFAGVVPVSPAPRLAFMAHYWRNAQYLPFYLLCGDQSGAAYKATSKLYEEWAPRGYNSLMVIYKGRGHEFFIGELPTIFDWMATKRRAGGFPELGRNPGAIGNNEEFQSLRQGDNSFYWVTIRDVQPKHLWNGNGRPPTPAKVQATIRPNNQISVWTNGFTELSLWIGPDMIDVEKPVSVSVQSGTKIYPKTWNSGRKPLTPSLPLMLEDFYQRADPKRLYFTRIDFDKL
jgi:predicted esterase